MILQRSSGSLGNSTTALLAIRAALSRGSSSTDVLEPEAQASGVSLKIGRTLSMRGITLCRWKFAMSAATVNPLRSRRSSASVRTLSLA